MGLLTIGSFARAARLSPKALRLYDELGLLRPAQVDPNSGYRFYDLDQLEQARLVAWLRRLGMPLAQIRVVCGMPGPDAAPPAPAAPPRHRCCAPPSAGRAARPVRTRGFRRSCPSHKVQYKDSQLY